MAFPIGWGRRAPIVIDAVAEALTDFPVHLDKDCFPAEALDSGSANKALSDGADLRFSTTSAGTTELPFEVVRWVQDAVAGNRKATVHVKVPALTVGATTTIYVWYKNASATMPAAGDANGRNAVWSSYAHVLHLNSTSAATNSTGATAWTYEGTPASTYEGPAGLMLDLDGTDDAVQGPSYNPSDHLLELLVQCDATADQVVVGRSLTGGSAHVSETVWVSSSKPTAFIDTDGALSYGYSFADTVNASTSAVELWQVRNRSTAGGQVVTKALPSAEQSHQAWANNGTYLYSIGGHQLTTSSPVTNNNRYNPGTDSWSTLTALPVARWGMASAILSGKIYCMGGTTNGTAASSRNDIYDIAGDSWSAGAALPASLTASVAQGQSACTDGTYIYVMAANVLERYDPVGDSWTSRATHPVALGTWQSLICDGTYIYCLGGSALNANIRRYVIGTNTWDAAVYDVAPYAAWAMVCEPVGDGTYLIGFGRKGSSLEQSAELYNWNLSSKVWTQLNRFDMPTNAAAAAVISSKLYVYGAWVIGKAETYSFGHHACYNLSTGVWDTVPAVVEFARDGTWISGRILTSAPYAGSGRWYVGRQDGLTTLRSGAKVGEVRISASARSKEWMRQTRATLMTASSFAAVGTAVDAPIFLPAWAHGSNSIVGSGLPGG